MVGAGEVCKRVFAFVADFARGRAIAPHCDFWFEIQAGATLEMDGRKDEMYGIESDEKRRE